VAPHQKSFARFLDGLELGVGEDDAGPGRFGQAVGLGP